VIAEFCARQYNRAGGVILKRSRVEREEAAAKASVIKKIMLGTTDRDRFLSALFSPPEPKPSLGELFSKTPEEYESER
jgi:hypothetical protein